MKRIGAAIVWGLALAFIAMAPSRALAQPAAYTANCTGGGCHVNPTNPFRVRRLRPGYVRLRGKLGRGTDSAAILSEDRERASPS